MLHFLTEPEIGQKVTALVAHARRDHGIGVGCSAEEACRRIGLTIQSELMSLDTDGMLVDKKVIINRTITYPPRVEFTIFHEIVHFLLDEDGDLIEYFTAALRNNAGAFRSAIERCCHQGAAEFLMPREIVREAILAERFSALMVERIANRHGASIIAAAIQVATNAPSSCYLVLCCYSEIARSLPASQGLFIEYAPASYSIKYPLARFTPVPNDHLLTQVWETGLAVEGRSYIPFRSGKRQPCYCHAVMVGSRVVGVLQLQPPTPPEQLSLHI